MYKTNTVSSIDHLVRVNSINKQLQNDAIFSHSSITTCNFMRAKCINKNILMSEHLPFPCKLAVTHKLHF